MLKFKDGAFERGLGHADGALTKVTTQRSLVPSIVWGHPKNIISDSGRGPSPDTKSAGALTVDFTAFWTARNQFLLFTSHSINGILLQQPSWTETLVYMFLCESVTHVFPGNFQSIVFSIASILSFWDFNCLYLHIYHLPYDLTFHTFCLLVSLYCHDLGNHFIHGFHLTHSLFSCTWHASKPSADFFFFWSYIWFFLEMNLFTFENLSFLFHEKFSNSYF